MPGHDDLKAIISAKGAEEKFSREELLKVMVMAETKPRDTHILDRGDYLNPKEKVSISTPAFLPPMPDDLPRNRLGIARWLFLPEQPLTARVQVNRMWQLFFGTGLVKTSEDLGVQSEVPEHQELLDWLAVEFRESGWKMKHMHRLIVTSGTYRQSSRVRPDHLEKDPDNRLMARASRFRLPSMLLRDLALSSGGLLDARLYGKPVYPYQPEGIWDTLAITKERDFSYPQSSGKDLHRRSLYTFWRRTVAPANMFDSASRQICSVKPSLTNTPLHALTTLNDPTWVEAARGLATRVIRHSPDTDARLIHAMRLVTARTPSASQTALLQRMMENQRTHFSADPASAKAFITNGATPPPSDIDPVELATWSATALGILNLDPALTRE